MIIQMHAVVPLMTTEKSIMPRHHETTGIIANLLGVRGTQNRHQYRPATIANRPSTPTIAMAIDTDGITLLHQSRLLRATRENTCESHHHHRYHALCESPCETTANEILAMTIAKETITIDDLHRLFLQRLMHRRLDLL